MIKNENAIERTVQARQDQQHSRGVRLLYAVMALGLGALIYGQCSAGPALQLVTQQGSANPATSAPTTDASTIPRAQLQQTGNRLIELRVGESACLLLGWAVSREGHVWLREEQEVVEDCAPSVLDIRVTRLKDRVEVREGAKHWVFGGWKAEVRGPVPVWGTDAEWEGTGWVKAEKVEVVK